MNEAPISDFLTLDSSFSNPFYDLNWQMNGEELYGINAINQAIDNILLTDPGERLFNFHFFSPLVTLLFQKTSIAEDRILDDVFTTIEGTVGNIVIDRESADVEVDSANHSVSFSINYLTSSNQYGRYSRIIGV